MVSRLCLLVVVAWMGWTTGQAVNYCKFTPEHTMCKYSGRGPACGPQKGPSGVNQEDAALIVALHNQLRSKVARGEETRGAYGPQPSGANIIALEWDEELAAVAQRHADQCVFNHECYDCRRVDRFTVGQNLYLSMKSGYNQHGSDWRSAILAWYNEVAQFPGRTVQSYQSSRGTGHYTQMLWARTSRIGCGFTTFREGTWIKGLYTCNYGPGGNMLNSPMYLRGTPCSSCPDGTSCSEQYQGLCEYLDKSHLQRGPKPLHPNHRPEYDDYSQEYENEYDNQQPQYDDYNQEYEYDNQQPQYYYYNQEYEYRYHYQQP